MSNTPIKVAIHGAAGRMGQRLVALGSTDDELQIVAALDSPKHPKLGEDAGVVARLRSIGVPLAATLTVPVDVVIDFSIPAATMSILKTCLEKKIALVVATTGLNDEAAGSAGRSGEKNSGVVVAEHEPDGEPGDAIGGNLGAGARGTS